MEVIIQKYDQIDMEWKDYVKDGFPSVRSARAYLRRRKMVHVFDFNQWRIVERRDKPHKVWYRGSKRKCHCT